MNGKLLRGLIIIIVLTAGIYIYSFHNPSESQLFPKCPVYLMTGYKCAGCGSQRALHSFFSGDFAEAFSHNLLIFPLLFYILVIASLEYFSNRSLPAVRKLRAVLLGKWTLIALMTLIVLFTAARNW